MEVARFFIRPLVLVTPHAVDFEAGDWYGNYAAHLYKGRSKVDLFYNISIGLFRIGYFPKRNYVTIEAEYYNTHQAMPSEVLVDRWEGVNGQKFVGQAYPTHALLDSSPVSMLANPYG
ncbi:hypothetical protein TNCV_1219521 [Trichonephila clavipes]|nr:hypothetical protein TNCV_1219521 [Trichonephila clavipes]